MKKLLLMVAVIAVVQLKGVAQKPTQELASAVIKLDNAKTVADYQALANDFAQIAESGNAGWLPYYYAAFCNAKVAWLYEDDGEKIEPFANLAEEQIKKSHSFLDTASQKNELSEVYCVLNMLNRARVFINPATYGSQYGPKASAYMRLALKTNPENPRAIYLEGWEKFATPKTWGGDKAKAKELLLEARQKLDANLSAGNGPHWGKQEVETLLMQLK